MFHFQTRIFQQRHNSLACFVDFLRHAGLVQLWLAHWVILKIVSHTYPPIFYFRLFDILSFQESCLERSLSRQMPFLCGLFQRGVTIQFKPIKSQFMGEKYLTRLCHLVFKWTFPACFLCSITSFLLWLFSFALSFFFFTLGILFLF